MMVLARQLELLNFDNPKIIAISAMKDSNQFIFKVSSDFKTEDLCNIILPKNWYLSLSKSGVAYLKSFESSTKFFIEIQS